MATSRLIRFFSRRQTKPSAATQFTDESTPVHDKSHSIVRPQPTPPVKQGLICTVMFLDGEHVNFEVDVSRFSRRVLRSIDP